MSLVRLIARPLLAAAVVAQGVDVVRHPREHAEKAAPLVSKISDATGLPDEPEKYVRASGAVLAGAGVLLGTGMAPRAAGWTIAGLLAPVSVIGYQFWTMKDKTKRQEARRTFISNAAVVGGALLAGVDTAGRPSVSWRLQARRTQRDRVAEAVQRAVAKERKSITA